MKASKIRLLLVDDHLVVRMGIASMLNGQPDMEVVGEAGSGEEALARCQQVTPAVVLMDLRLPGMSGIECTAALRKLDAPPRVIVLTSFDDGENVYQALQAGAHAYILKDLSPSELLQTIRAVHAGEYRLAPAASAQLARRVPGELSSRELAILRLVSRGRSNKEVGDKLEITESTVKGHLNNILAKLHASDRTEAVTIALRRGLISLESV
jgi:two-component system NarL family response regulator